MTSYTPGHTETIRREAAAAGREARAAKKPGVDHCAVCREENCECFDAHWSAGR